MDHARTHVLLIEDNPGDARLIREMLAEGPPSEFELVLADRLAEGLARLSEGGIDVILLDLMLPDAYVLQTLQRTLQHASNVPIIVLTGLDNQHVGMEAVQAGAQDYLIKGQIDRNLLTRAIRYAIERGKLTSQLKDALANVKTLRGLLPTCAWCKKIRDDKGSWHTVESYVRDRSDADFSHGMCPDCFTTHYPDAPLPQP